MRISLTDYNRDLVIACQKGALKKNHLQGVDALRFPFPLPQSQVKEIYDADGYPWVQNEAMRARDVLLRSFVDAPLEDGMVGPIYSALLCVHKHYRCDPLVISTTLENIFLRASLSNDAAFVEQVVTFLRQDNFVSYIDWQKMLALTGRFELLPDLRIDIPAALPWWRLTANAGNIKAMALVAEHYVSTGEIDNAKYYLTVMTTLMRAVHAGIIDEDNANLVRAGVRALASIYLREGHRRQAKRCDDLLADVPLEELSNSGRLDALSALFNKHKNAVYPFNSAKGNAIQLLCDECPISYDRFIALDNVEEALCAVNPTEWLSQDKIDRYLVISEQGYLYGRVSAQLWQQNKKHKDPLNRGEFVLRPSLQPLDLVFLNALLNLQRLRLGAFNDFVAVLPSAWFEDETLLFLLAHLHPGLLNEKYIGNIESIFADDVGLEKIIKVNNHFVSKYAGRLFAGKNEGAEFQVMGRPCAM